MIYCVEDDDNIRELVIYTLETTGLKAKGFADGSDIYIGDDRAQGKRIRRRFCFYGSFGI